MDKLPMTGEYTTYALQESNPSLPDYVTDSAASGTGWATGSKTSNGRISTTAGTDKDLQTILEIAQSRGLATGDVSTAELTDATPAVLGAHVNNRNCQGATDMADCPQDKKSAGGPGSIAEQLVDHKIDVLLGGGRGRFEQKIEGGPDNGKTVVASAQGQGYSYVTDGAGMAANTKTPVLGLFTSGNMTLEWKGDLAKPGAGSGPQKCQEGQRPSNEPSLEEMARKAVQLLDQKVSGGAPGFLLQIEGSSIDKQDHAANPCGQIGETIAFDRAIKAMMDYAATRTDTLVIVTADHGHTSQIIPLGAKPLGLSSTLITADGAQMRIHYGTAAEGGSQEHTGTEVRIAAMGPGAPAVLGIINQTDLFKILLNVMTDGAPAMPGLPSTGGGGGRNTDLGWLVLPAALLALFGAGVVIGRRRRV
jgi:alkaline phosphatase/streptomycin-6-phosphatase